MAFWYVDDIAQPNGDHLVHHDSCFELSLSPRKSLIGSFTNCRDALAKSRVQHYQHSNGCPVCAPGCHRA